MRCVTSFSSESQLQLHKMGMKPIQMRCHTSHTKMHRSRTVWTVSLTSTTTHSMGKNEPSVTTLPVNLSSLFSLCCLNWLWETNRSCNCTMWTALYLLIAYRIFVWVWEICPRVSCFWQHSRYQSSVWVTHRSHSPQKKPLPQCTWQGFFLAHCLAASLLGLVQSSLLQFLFDSLFTRNVMTSLRRDLKLNDVDNGNLLLSGMGSMVTSLGVYTGLTVTVISSFFVVMIGLLCPLDTWQNWYMVTFCIIKDVLCVASVMCSDLFALRSICWMIQYGVWWHFCNKTLMLWSPTCQI